MGIWNEDEHKWEWDPKFIENHPEYAQKCPQPEWEDILCASIQEGDWTDFEEWVRERIESALEEVE